MEQAESFRFCKQIRYATRFVTPDVRNYLSIFLRDFLISVSLN